MNADSGSITYSVGQIFTEDLTSQEGNVSPGVQQGYEIFLVGIDHIPALELNVEVYPNPVSDFLILSYKEEATNIKYLAYLADVNGNFIWSDEVREPIYRLEVSNLVSGVYFLLVSEDEKLLKTFKIIKK